MPGRCIAGLGKDGYFDLWLMNPDGTGQKCLTADHPLLANKHIEQPAWHPTGRLLVIQVQKAHVPRYADTKCTPGAGALNDLWIITADGKRIVWMSSKNLPFRIKPFDLETDFWLMNIDGSRKERLTRFHEPQHPHYLVRPFAVAADSDWSPGGNHIIRLVITNRPDTRRRGSGIIVLIDLPTR